MKKLLIVVLTLSMFGCGQSHKDIEKQKIIKKLNDADSQLVDSRNKLNNLLREHDSVYLRDVLNQIDSGIDSLQEVERDLQRSN